MHDARSFEMPSRGLLQQWMSSIFVLAAILGFPCALVSQADAAHRPANARNAGRDLSGIWMLHTGGATFSKEPPPPMTPWAAARFAANKPTMGPDAVLDANDPTVNCHPPGVPYILIIPTPFEIVQAPGQVLELFEYDHSLRRIHTDGRQHPQDLQDTEIYQWMGHSIASWDGDTLIIDTIGFNDKTWLDRLGHTHSDALHIVERLRRVDHDTLLDNLNLDDPKAYLKPWTGQLLFKLKPGWEIMEHNCVSTDNEGRKYLEYQKRAWQAPN
jgi:hypothetical protein